MIIMTLVDCFMTKLLYVFDLINVHLKECSIRRGSYEKINFRSYKEDDKFQLQY